MQLSNQEDFFCLSIAQGKLTCAFLQAHEEYPEGDGFIVRCMRRI